MSATMARYVCCMESTGCEGRGKFAQINFFDKERICVDYTSLQQIAIFYTDIVGETFLGHTNATLKSRL